MKLQLSYEGFLSPITLIQNSNQDNLLYIGTQTGTIYKIDVKTGESKVFMDVQDLLVKLNKEYDERGLLDFAFHPDYPVDNRLFIFYSAPFNQNYANYLSEFTISESFDEEDNVDIQEQVLLIVEKKENCHNGGRLLFGPDGYLYLALGDGCAQEDPNNHGQRPDVVFGKVLRFDISTPGVSKVPKDNPFIDMEGYSPLIYALGFRNPWGMSFDPEGRLFLADVGYNDIEEIDIVTKGGNYGWSLKEGSMKTSFGQENVTGIPLIDPIYEYNHNWIKSLGSYGPEGDKQKKAIAIIGGYPLSDGSYIFGDLSGLIMRIRPNGNRWELIDSVSIDKFIKGFGKDNSGNVYILTSDTISPYSNGQIYLIE